MSGCKPIFDVERPIEIKLQSAEGIKAIALRFPTDAEWIERQRKRKVTTKHLGRGFAETIVPDYSDADLEFVRQIRTGEGGPEIDGYEAEQIVERLSRCDAREISCDAGIYRILMTVPGGETVHILHMPNAKDLSLYRRGFARRIDAPMNQQQLTVNLIAAAGLYKKLDPQAEGYAGAVPIMHQVIAVNCLIEAIESGLGVADSENF